MVIKTGKQLGGSTTTAQSWMTLAGSIADTGVMNIPKNENEFRFQVRNSLASYFCVNFGTKQGEKTAIARVLICLQRIAWIMPGSKLFTLIHF